MHRKRLAAVVSLETGVFGVVSFMFKSCFIDFGQAMKTIIFGFFISKKKYPYNVYARGN